MKRDPLPCVVGAAAALFYLAWPSSFYNMDGVACAIAVELGDLRHLVHGNHVLYGLVGLAFHRLWQLLGYQGPAILPLQTLNSLIGATGAAVFCALLLRLRFQRSLAAAATAGLIVSQAYWFWSLEAQVYPLGVVFCALAWLEANAEEPRAARVGLWHGLAILGHLGHVMLAAPLLYLLAGSGRSKRDLWRYASAATAVVLIGYGIATALVEPKNVQELRSWMLGSAALTLDHSFRWHGGYSWAGLGAWLRMTARVFADFDGLRPTLRALACALDAVILGACAVGLAQGRRDGRRRAPISAAVWIAAYALLYVSWEPFTVVYRLSDLLPLWLLAAFGFERLGRHAAGLTALAAAALLVFNTVETIAPRCDARANAALQETLWISRRVPENAWIAATDLGQVYVPYFAHLRPLNMRYFADRPLALQSRLDEIAASGEAAYVTLSTLEAGEAAGWARPLREYGLKPAGSGATILYRLMKPARTESQTAAARKN